MLTYVSHDAIDKPMNATHSPQEVDCIECLDSRRVTFHECSGPECDCVASICPHCSRCDVCGEPEDVCAELTERECVARGASKEAA